jgi:hypothetical protein
MLFRGQNRDYFEEGVLSVLPVACRNQGRAASQLLSGRGPLVKAADTWCGIIEKSFNLDMRKGFAFMPDKCAGAPVAFHVIDRSVSARLSYNLHYAGLLQHYGFPTPNLDLSEDPIIGLWFALNKASREEGRLIFSHLHESTERILDASSFGEGPSVYVYLENIETSKVMDLRQCPGLSSVAVRPERQKAYSLPFLVSRPSIHASIGSHGTPLVSRGYTHHAPVAVIKINMKPSVIKDLNQSLLFPLDDPVYAALLGNDAPYLAIYGEQR